MLNAIGSFIHLIYQAIGNYAIVLLIIGMAVGFLRIVSESNSLKNFKIKKRLAPEVAKIKEEEISEDEKTEKLNKLFKDNNFNAIPGMVIKILTSIISLIMFMVMLHPYERIGLPSDFVQPFLYFSNIFEKSQLTLSGLDFILPLVVTIFMVAAKEVGKPKELMDFKKLLTNFLVQYLIYMVVGNLLSHMYMIYWIGLSLGRFLVGLFLCPLRRKAYFGNK